MGKFLLALSLSTLSGSVLAADNCEQIKSQIETKIKSLGVSVYKLEIVEKDANVGGKDVGSCDGGKKKIVYWRL
jgi:hypothetical protein